MGALHKSVCAETSPASLLVWDGSLKTAGNLPTLIRPTAAIAHFIIHTPSLEDVLGKPLLINYQYFYVPREN